MNPYNVEPILIEVGGHHIPVFEPPSPVTLAPGEERKFKVACGAYDTTPVVRVVGLRRVFDADAYMPESWWDRASELDASCVRSIDEFVGPELIVRIKNPSDQYSFDVCAVTVVWSPDDYTDLALSNELMAALYNNLKTMPAIVEQRADLDIATRAARAALLTFGDHSMYSLTCEQQDELRKTAKDNNDDRLTKYFGGCRPLAKAFLYVWKETRSSLHYPPADFVVTL